MKGKVLRIHPQDSVAVALFNLDAGQTVTVDELTVTLLQTIPPGHKFALHDIPAHSPVIKYGYPIGNALTAIPCGAHVHTHNLHTRLSGELDYTYRPLAIEPISEPCELPTMQAFERYDGSIGIRNELWIIPTVGCVNKVAAALADWGNRQIASGIFSGIDGVHAWEHPHGCSQLGDDHDRTQTILADLVRHPNAAGVLVVGLGCENNTIESFRLELGETDPQRVRFLITQQVADEIAEGRRQLETLAAHAKSAVRSAVPASRLVVGLKCGGSDGLSGITANPLVGRICDQLVSAGGTAILTEIPEMFGAEDLLLNRCASVEVYRQLVEVVNGFKHYYLAHNQVVYENPSPGNKEGGISTLEDKSLGCVQKGGTTPVQAVLGYGERVRTRGLHILAGPGNDLVSTTALAAAGAHLVLFTTGRGTPLGCPVPTLKISSNSALAQKKSGWIDMDAGRLLNEELSVVAKDLLLMILEVASGKTLTKNEKNGYREIAIFKDGVTL